MKVAMIGAGQQGIENLLPALKQVKDVEVVAVCDWNHELALKASQLCGNVPLFSDHIELMDQMELDAIVMACPPSTHRDVSMLAMERGIHVFVEKPPCVTSAELDALIELAQRKKVVTGVGLNFRYASPYSKMSEIMKSESFGSLVHFEIRHPADKPTQPMWGTGSTVRSFLLAQSIHTIDLACTLGGKIERVDAEVKDDEQGLLVKLSLVFENGVTGSLLTGNIFPYFDMEIMAVGDKRSVVSMDKLWNITVKDLSFGKRWQNAWHPSPLDSGYERSGYHGELNAFFNAIRTGSRFELDFASMKPTFDIMDEICSKSAVFRKQQLMKYPDLSIA